MSDKKIRIKPAAPAKEPSKLDRELNALRGRPRLSPLAKTLVIILVDASGSTHESGALRLIVHAGEAMLLEATRDAQLAPRAEFEVIAFDHAVTPLREFGPIEQGVVWHVDKELDDIGGGGTRGAAALNHAYGRLEARERDLSDLGVATHAKVVVFMTDGHGADSPQELQAVVAKREELVAKSKGRFRLFGVAAGPDVDMDKLRTLCPETFELSSLERFEEFWKWIYEVTRTVSMTDRRDRIDMPSPFCDASGNPTGFAENDLRSLGSR